MLEPDVIIKCDCCKQDMDAFFSNNTENEIVCDDCRSTMYDACAECGSVYHIDEMQDGYCQEHYQEIVCRGLVG